MRTASTLRKLLSLLLVLTILGSLLVPAVSADPGTEQERIEEGQDYFSADSRDESEDRQEDKTYAPDDVVRVSIFLEDAAPIDAGFSMDYAAKNPALVSYRNQLRAKQDAVRSRIESAVGGKLDVRMNLTLLVNAISANVRYGDIETIKGIPGVADVGIELQYETPEPVEEEPAQPNTANTSTYMVGASEVWAEGYTGAGARIAIIDTGLDTTHQSFAADAFEYAIQQTGKEVSLFTQADFNAIKSQLNANNPVYTSSKIPYGFNYADNNTNINHLNDVQGEHGSHVAGIAAANRFIRDGSSYVDAASAVGAVGMAPDAQLFIMKVFGNMGPYESTYIGAIEDAITLDCDVVNLSLGSSNPGFSYSAYYQNTWSKLANINANTKLVVSISSGNSYSFADFLKDENGDRYDLYIDDVHMHSGGDPGSYVNSLCVASASNLFMRGETLTFNGSQEVFYNETDNNGGKMVDVAGNYSYVYIDAVGSAEDYSAVNAQESLQGKIVMVNRGEISFVDKGNNAISYAPKGLIVANNVAGSGVNMSLSGYNGSFPMVSITLGDAQTIRENSTVHTAGSITYYTGTVQVNAEEITAQVSTNPEMSAFSSWGIPGSLTMKPEITAPGGNIYSVYGTNKGEDDNITGGPDQYELMSGTSMAAPHIAGLTGTLGQYLRENNIAVSGRTTRQIVQSLLMSTAVPMHIGSADGPYYPILHQGAGLANVRQAVHASSILFMNADATRSWADGKVKAELGDKPSRSGAYTWSFDICNTADQAQTYALSTDLFTQARYEGEDGYAHMSSSTTALNWPVSYSTGDSVTVPAGGSKTVTVTISIPADMSDFDALYPSGAYVEGFTYVESQTTTTDGAQLDVRHSIPILGFYGSWTDPSMFDNMSYVDKYVYGETRNAYSGSADTNYITYTRGSSSAAKYITGNPYLTETPFPADRLAMRPTDTVKLIRYTLIRSAGTTGIGVSKIDEEGLVNQVLYAAVDDTNTVGMYYSTSSASWQNTYAMTTAPQKTFASYGAVSGDRIRFGYYAIPEYNAMQVNEDLSSATAGVLSNEGFRKVLLKNVLGKGVMIGYDFYMDDTAPVILSAVRNESSVIVTARDDNWIAKLALLNGSKILEELIPEQTVRGQAVTYSFDISGVSDPSNLKVFVGDYAANETTRVPEELLYAITASSNNTAWGTVSVMGNTILCTPAEGYYVQEAQVSIGSANPVISGNTITVNPTADCAILVVFAPKPVITVRYLANGEDEGTASGYIYDTVKLPETIQNTNVMEDYSFIGWMDAVLLETTEAPVYYAPGASYTLTQDTTLYALFKRVEGNDGEIFRLVTTQPADLEGRYVFTSGTGSDCYILPVIPAGEFYKDHMGETRLSDTGASVANGSVMTEVPAAYIFNVVNSATAGYYSIKSVSLDGARLADLSAGFGSTDNETNNSIWTLTLANDSKFNVATKAYNTWAIFFNSNVSYFATSNSDEKKGIYLWKGEPAGTAFFTTNPVAENHTHELEHHAAAAPTCAEDGNSEYWRCAICGKYFSDALGEKLISFADTVLPATGLHSYEGAPCVTNSDGTHNRACTVCGQVETVSCTYEDVVTPPTQTTQGYTTHTCVHCGYSFKDSYVPALGSDFTVTFSVLGNTELIAPAVCNSAVGITLPTVQAPAGWKFLGWVISIYDNVTEKPTQILTGQYIAPEDVTLYALFSYVEGGDGTVGFQLLTEAPSDWEGRYVVTYMKSASSNVFTVLTGVNDSVSYEGGSTLNGATKFAETGIELADDMMYGVSDLYIFAAEPSESSWLLKNVEKQTYLVSQSYTLYGKSSSASGALWTLDVTSTGSGVVHNLSGGSWPRLGFNSNGRFRLCNTTDASLSNIFLWRETEAGTRYYTTIDGENPHTHTVQYHAEEPASCTENGVKAYYYCSDPACPLAGKKFEDEALTLEITNTVIAALGHDFGDWTQTTAPTCTAAGEETRACSRCDAVETRSVPALGHDWGNPSYVWSEDNSEVTASRYCLRDASHTETETVPTSFVVTVEPTLEQEGEIVYTAVFQNAAFATQTKTVVLPRLDEPTLPCDGGNDCPGKIFEDMPAKGHWAHDPIDWALVNHITAGTSETTFSPKNVCSRAQVVTFLWRAAGSPEPESTENHFTDVPAGSYYEKAVLWAVENQITAGTSPDKFSPKATCSRAQIAVFLWRYAGSPEPADTLNPFRDVAEDAYYAPAVLWALENGVTAGTSETTFSPDAVCSRAQVVTFLYRYLVK